MKIHVITQTWYTINDGTDCTVLAAFNDFDEAVKYLETAMEDELESSYGGDRSSIDLDNDTIRCLCSEDHSDIFEIHEVELK